jgi:peptidoglycan-associated lipoprotein
MNIISGLKIVGAAGLMVLAAACASSNTTGPDLAAGNSDNSGAYDRPSGPVAGSAEDFAQTAGDRVFFGYDQYTLTPQARATLAAQADWLKQYGDKRILVAGNADERGTREYNLALGARRAEAARAYLISLGVPGNRISTVSYGKERPVDPRSTEEAWALNRNATSGIVGAGS